MGAKLNMSNDNKSIDGSTNTYPSRGELDLPSDCFVHARQNDGFQIPYFLSTEYEVSKVRPPDVVKTWEQRFAELSATQKSHFLSFYAAVQKESWYDAIMHDTWNCLRNLTACSYNEHKALKLLKSSTEWHQANDKDSQVCQTCLADPNKHYSQFVGWDKQHRPVMLMSMRWGPERKNPLQHMICAFNHLIRMMPVGVEQWICLTDFETYSHLKDGRPGMGLNVMKILQNYYVERLGKMFLIDPPKVFSMLWAVAAPLIDPVTKTKIEMVYSDKTPSIYDVFPKFFPPDLCGYIYDTYHRSKHNLPATPLIWHPKEHGYPASGEEYFIEKKAQKSRAHKKS